MQETIRYHCRKSSHSFRKMAKHGEHRGESPDVFRIYAAPTVFSLLRFSGCSVPFSTAFVPGSLGRAAPFSIASLSEFLFYSMSLSAFRHLRQGGYSKRVVPSAGALYPLEVHLLLPPFSAKEADRKGAPMSGGMSDNCTVAHYLPQSHAVECRTHFPVQVFRQLIQQHPAKSAFVPAEGSFLVLISAIHFRIYYKYGDRGLRYSLLDAGHALAALSLSAMRLGFVGPLLFFKHFFYWVSERCVFFSDGR